MEAQQPSMASSRVSTPSIERAVKALLKWKSKSSKHNDDEFLYLVLTLNKIPPNFRTPDSPLRIHLPHPLFSPYTSDFRSCLLVEDRFSLSSKQKIENDNLPINNVIKLSKFRSDFKSFEEKKKLCDSYGLFLADKRVIPILPKLIGRCFYKRKKGPIGIELGRSDWKEQIEKVCGSAMLNLKMGTCVVIKVARVSMGREEIVENVIGAANGVAQVVPKKWKNVRGFHLKLAESIALPVYEMGVRDGEVGKVGEEGGEVGRGEGEDEEERGENGEVGKKRMKGVMKKVSMVKKEEKGLKMKKDEVLAKYVTEKNSKKRKSLV